MKEHSGMLSRCVMLRELTRKSKWKCYFFELECSPSKSMIHKVLDRSNADSCASLNSKSNVIEDFEYLQHCQTQCSLKKVVHHMYEEGCQRGRLSFVQLSNHLTVARNGYDTVDEQGKALSCS